MGDWQLRATGSRCQVRGESVDDLAMDSWANAPDDGSIMSQLRLSDSLALPLDWMTMATVVYGARGSGKTTLGRVVAEELWRNGQRFVAVDLKGDWHGLKSTADGEGAAIPVVIFGGEHADLPLEDGSGALIGEIVATHDQPFVVDLERLSKGRQVRWLKDFFLSLYHHNRRPLLVIADEIQRYAPQRPMSPDETICLGAVEDVVKLGRKHGLGILALTQRGAGLNKEVSELCDMLVALRTPGPLDQDRIKDWLDANTTRAQRDQVMGQLAKLPTGTAVVASGHPDIDVFTTAAVRRSETFDSSATPKVGQTIVAPRVLAPVDIAAIRERLTPTPEPVELTVPTKGERRALAEQMKRIVDLEEQNRSLRSRPAFDAAAIDRLKVLCDELSGVGMRILDAVGDVRSQIVQARPLPPAIVEPQQQATTSINRPSRFDRTRRTSAPAVATPVDLSSPQIRILEVLASFQALGVDSVARSNVAVFADVSPRSSGFSNNLGALRTKGLLDYPSGGTAAITEAGLECVDEPKPIYSLDQLHEAWYAKLSNPQRRILEQVIRVYPDGVGRHRLAQISGQSPTSSGYSNNLGSLRSLGLVTYPSRGAVAASDLLFPDGLR